MKIKVGFGYDVHVLKEGEELVLGGVNIEHTKGTIAHSDGDVLIHSICDALLGAANLRDIGYHFPDTDEKFENIDSTVLLSKVEELLSNKGFSIGNIDTTIVAEQPKINPHISKMQDALSSILKIDQSDISIKATTNERMGFEGREEGISVYAVALIEKK
jgi:2-C-methyl-D-erythritol 2,4-cyclodiphosphate synthase